MIEIPLSKKGKNKGKYIAIVDDCDSDLAELNWRVSVLVKLRYAKRLDSEYLHRIVMSRVFGRDLQKDEFVDHINGNGLDNRRENLRLATHQQNMQNRGKQINNTSGYKGVTLHTKNRNWVAHIKIDGKAYHIGVFDTPEEAYEAYKARARIIQGEFANLENH